MSHRISRVAAFAAVSFASMIAAEQAQAVTIDYGPTPYLSSADSPFAASVGQPDFYLEDFEDNTFQPGWSGGGSITGPGGITDSVDADDGTIDGSGQQGRSHFGGGAAGLTYTFNAVTLGGLPTAAGIVWTDGATLNTVTFRAFDAGDNLITEIIGNNIGDGNFNSGTAEDRFFGVYHDGGIARIFINSIGLPGASGSGIEVDHLQYGAFTPTVGDDDDDTSGVPAPAALPAGLALLAFAAMRRRR